MFLSLSLYYALLFRPLLKQKQECYTIWWFIFLIYHLIHFDYITCNNNNNNNVIENENGDTSIYSQILRTFPLSISITMKSNFLIITLFYRKLFHHSSFNAPPSSPHHPTQYALFRHLFYSWSWHYNWNKPDDDDTTLHSRCTLVNNKFCIRWGKLCETVCMTYSLL